MLLIISVSLKEKYVTSLSLTEVVFFSCENADLEKDLGFM